jgi:hypothetical protein
MRASCGSFTSCSDKIVGEIRVLNYMMAYVNASHYIRKEVYGDKPEDLPEGLMVRQNAKLCFKAAQLHLKDLEDMENNIMTLCKSLPEVLRFQT